MSKSAKDDDALLRLFSGVCDVKLDLTGVEMRRQSARFLTCALDAAKGVESVGRFFF